MLLEFCFRNFRSFRDEAVLSLEATEGGALRQSLIGYNHRYYLPGAVILGKNGGGKSNVIRAFWFSVQFIRNAQRTQEDGALVPVTPFRLDDCSGKEPMEVSFVYTVDGVKYWYQFSATRERIVTESLYSAPRGQKALVFFRSGQDYRFTRERAARRMIAKVVAENQLFFATACALQDQDCIAAMSWFRKKVLFPRGSADFGGELCECADGPGALMQMKKAVCSADLGIEDMQFTLNGQAIGENTSFPPDTAGQQRTAVRQFVRALSENPADAQARLAAGQIEAIFWHRGVDRQGNPRLYSLRLQDESEGARALMALAPAVESALETGGIVFVDDLERGLHPHLVEWIVSRFQSRRTNPHGAQIVFTTQDTGLLHLNVLRSDQIYFADKSKMDGASELYGVRVPAGEDLYKAYLYGKYGAVPDVESEEAED